MSRTRSHDDDTFVPNDTLQRVVEFNMTMKPHAGLATESGSAHPSTELMAAFLDERLTGTERDTFVDHLTDCPNCRKEFRETRGLQQRLPRRSFKWWIPTGAALAAILALVVVPSLRRQGNAVIAERGTAPQVSRSAISGIDVVTPRGENAVLSKELHFLWRADARDTEYRLSLQDSSGHLVWSTTTSDTVTSLPASLRIGAGDYFWTVDALRADGRTATTGVQRLTIK
ncbi:MAG: zf-HC2 domain-containing protein [Gemmatimonadaceae bacterium]